MKKIIALVCFAFAFMPAQKLFAQQFSLGAGMATHVYLFHEGSSVQAVGAPGLSLDFEVVFPFSQTVGLTTGASFTGVAGYHFGGNKALNLGEIYFDVPVRAKFFIPLSRNVQMSFFTGPVLSTNLVSIDAHSSHVNDNYDTFPHLRRFDILFGAGLGFDIIDHIRVTAGVDYGLIDRNGLSGDWCHRGQLKLSAQYIF
jgi:hypothetical protein